MQVRVLIAVFLLASCAQKTKEKTTDIDFTDKVISFATSELPNQYIELPELYSRAVTFIPEDGDQNLIIAEKLKRRGFVQTGIQLRSLPLNGRRYFVATLVKNDCECNVMKTFYATGNISQYRVTESISCKYIQPNKSAQ